jgi:hypothetical protein
MQTAKRAVRKGSIQTSPRRTKLTSPIGQLDNSFLETFEQGLEELKQVLAEAQQGNAKVILTPEPGYTDADCIQLLNQYSENPESFDMDEPKLYACMRPQPCRAPEKEVVTHGRAFCTKRSNKTVIQNLPSTIELLNKRVDMIDIEKKTNTDDSLKLLKIKWQLQEADSQVDDAVQQLQTEDQTLTETEKALQDAPDLVRDLKAWADLREKQDVQNAQREMTEKLLHLTEGQAMLAGMNAQLIELQRRTTKTLDKLEARTEKLEAKMDKTYEAALHTLGEESWSTQIHRLMKGGVRTATINILTAPLSIFKLVFWRPWKKAFNYWIWDRVEFIWGTILLVASLLMLLVMYHKFGAAYPELMQICMGGLKSLGTSFVDMNEVWMRYLGEETVEMLQQDAQYILSGVGTFWSWLMGQLVALARSGISFITQEVVGGVTAAVKSMTGGWFGFSGKQSGKKKSVKKSTKKCRKGVKKSEKRGKSVTQKKNNKKF